MPDQKVPGPKEAQHGTARRHEHGQDAFKSILAEDLDWKPFAAFPPSVRLAVVVGHPSAAGPYTIRVRVPNDVKLMPHRHPEDRVYTVMSGVFYIGLGDHFDPDKLQAYPPGSVIVLPGNTSHFHWARSGEYVTQITANGPLGLEYVSSRDDPRMTRRRNMRIVMVLTSHDQLGDTGRKTGFWLEEFAAPYFVFRDAGVELTLASPKGGQPPIDPKSDLPENQTDAMARFKRDEVAQKALAQTIKLDKVQSADYDTVFYVGGHGPMWDLAESPVSIALLESFYNSGKPIALVCHSPGVLRRVTYNGAPLVKGKRVTGFTNDEEAEVQLTHVVPFLVEDELKRLGATFEKAPNWQPFSIVDGRLITGQNPASSTSAAQALLRLFAGAKAA
jgi:putative intracellular protease/amidase